MGRTLREAFSDSLWEAWDGISCPALVVRAERGVSLPDARAMRARGRSVTLVDVAGAEHDVHLDRPDEWREAVSSFLDALP
jgi:pimeloyl-ACP methyl ester carboxylesterase